MGVPAGTIATRTRYLLGWALKKHIFLQLVFILLRTGNTPILSDSREILIVTTTFDQRFTLTPRMAALCCVSCCRALIR